MKNKITTNKHTVMLAITTNKHTVL